MGFVQSSFNNSVIEGQLYMVATPIGNLDDMTPRAIQILKEVDFIAAEDTRQTRKLLNFFDIQTKVISYHEHNKEQKGDYLIEELQKGRKIALVSDAGLPGISDPGADIARLAIEAHIPVIPIPGASASLTSLIAAGLSTNRFLFYGFLDRQRNKRKKELEKLKGLPFTMIFYEAPHRIIDSLQDMQAVLGDREVSVGRELTKKFEQFIRGPISFCMEIIENQKIQGEFTLVVSGASEAEQQDLKRQEQWWLEVSIQDHVNHYIGLGHDSKEAIKLVAKEREVPKRDVYQAYHEL
ncbi:16S rRNA (cytidine(1402)-2'-O)-methyltransferase [Desulfuribacillus stibiiarsenatis]|uniref:Ribosomal RNA small subunit methyltransferase I n=1 Tax=Desulfuribacillus stibiiarsenatis TaxID=1390249 RepID=A0A1E5L2I2_9FIRM|nr:16S rRNA (cytidine(1402)-2'-O)-methyltransferase [Desulfuribacillus stibiiarsenatis]OEH84326.1 16S rRNA (cytidine(1402)-2'-O)-methyltransferase [Desulfuribacillus stibiiarsenatis]